MSRPLFALISATALLLTSAFAPAQTVETKPEVKTEVLKQVTDRLTTSAFVPGINFQKWPEFLEVERGRIDSAKTDDEFARALNAALSKFGASHIVFFSPRATTARRSESTVGIGITSQPTPEGLLVIRTFKDSPADEGGLLPGEIITMIDNKPAETPGGIAGAEGTEVTLAIRGKSGEVRDVKLIRRKFSTRRPEELTWLDKDTARLTVHTFNLGYDAENVEKLMTEAQRARRLVLDLRDNGGGAIVNMEHLLGMLVPPDMAIGTYVGRSTVRRYREKTGQEAIDIVKVAETSDNKIRPRLNRSVPRFKGQVAVLVNRFSGSASEIVAAALRDTVGATVVGSKTAGAVLVSIIVPLSNGFSLQYPLQDYVTIKGQRLEGTGVMPDVVVEEPRVRLPGDPDPAADAAVQALAKAKGREIGTR